MTKEVIIIIPTFKTELLPDESISVRQVFNILSDYDICFIAPEGLDISYKEIEGKDYRIECFKREYFESVDGYSKLCTSSFFYEKFIDYEFMLIYQLDAFVFSDRLLEFCKAEYDYWGAPVSKVYWRYMPVNVGNGGLSLRRISKFLAITKHRDEIVNIINEGLPDDWRKEYLKNEDELLIYGSELFDETKLCLPSYRDAFSFSIEFNINSIYDDLEKHLPFGCHRWARYKFNKWWPIISGYGYDLDSEYIKELNDEKRDDSYNQLVLNELLSSKSEKELREMCKRFLGDSSISVWGLGKNSGMIIKEAQKYGLTIANKYDSDTERDSNVLIPNEDSISRESHPILITSTKYENDIRSRIESISSNTRKKISVYNINKINELFMRELKIDEIGETWTVV